MKHLLAFFALIFTMSAFGANPSYKDFIGTNGITVISNPPQGKIIFDGSGISGSVVAPPLSSIQFNSNGVMQGSSGLVFTNGNVGIGTTVPKTKLEIIGNGFALPATSGVTQSAGFMQRLDDTSAAVLDMGGAAGNGMWLQSVFKTDLSANLPLLLNPNGGTVAIGGLASAANSENLAVIGNAYIRDTIAVGRSSLGIMGTFYGWNTNGLNRDGIILNIRTVSTESGFHDVYGLAAHNDEQDIPQSIYDTGIRVGVTGDAYSRITNFAGRLDTQIGVRGVAGFALGMPGALVNNAYGAYCWIRNEAPGTKIDNAYGVYINNSATIGTITNRWDLYASSANAKNYFAGKVGIGIANPIETLDVSLPTSSEGMTLGTSPNSFGITTIEGANNYGLFSGVGSSGNAWLQVGSRTAATAYNLILQGSGGKVGIGTRTPSSTLDVTGQVRMASAYITNALIMTNNGRIVMGGGIPGQEMHMRAVGDGFGFSNAVTGKLSFFVPELNTDDWVMFGGLQASNLTLATLIGTGDHLAVSGGGVLMRTNITGLPAGSNFEVQFNNSGVMGASPNLRFLGGGYQLQIVNPVASGEVDINGEGFISQATGGSAALAFGIGAQTNLMINPGGALIVRPSPGLATNLFQVEGTNKVPIVSVSSNGTVLVSGQLQTDSIYVTNDVSALTFTDRSKAPDELADAYAIVASVTSTNGHVDHAKLHPLAWGTKQDGKAVVPDQTKRDMGMVISAQSLVIADLVKRLERLEKK